MLVNVIATGSSGNLYELIDSAGNSMLIEAGVPRGVYMRHREGSPSLPPEMVLISHNHSDHARYATEYHMVCPVYKTVDFARTEHFRAVGVPVEHGGERNNAYIIKSEVSGDVLVFATDLMWESETINSLISEIKNVEAKSGKAVERFMIELNYNQYLYHLATPEQRIGCDRHFSDMDLIRFFRLLGTKRPRILTIHGSDRLSTNAHTIRTLRQRLPTASVAVANGAGENGRDLHFL